MKQVWLSTGARIGVALVAMLLGAAARGDEAKSIAVIPGSVTLSGENASQQLLVESVVNARLAGDKTVAAKFESSDPAIATVDEAGKVLPVKDGEVSVTATVDGQSSTATIVVKDMKREATRS